MKEMRFSKTNQDKMKQVSDKKKFSTSSACFKTTWDGQLEIGVDIFNILCLDSFVKILEYFKQASFFKKPSFVLNWPYLWDI